MSITPQPAILMRWAKAWDGKGFSALELVLGNGRFYLPYDPHCPSPVGEIVFNENEYAIPSIIDFHVHIHERIADCDLADDFPSFARLAQISGIQAIGAFITESADSDLVTQYKSYDTAARKHFGGFVRWHLTPIQSSLDDIRPLLLQGCDLKFYTTYRSSGLYRSYEQIGHWMRDLTDLRPLMLVHCEDDDVITSAGGYLPFLHPHLHGRRRPPVAEIKAVDRICELSVRYNYPVHVVHVSTPQAAKLIHSARTHAPISCETSPNYLFLNDTAYDRPDGHRWLITPPLRSESLRGELRELAQDGMFDLYATDHCPFLLSDKDRHRKDPALVPNGIAGSGALLPLLIDKLGVSPEHVIARLCENPARLMNLGNEYRRLRPGDLARFIILRKDPGRNPSGFQANDASPSKTPYMPSLSDTFNPWLNQVSSTSILHTVEIQGHEAIPTNPVEI